MYRSLATLVVGLLVPATTAPAATGQPPLTAQGCSALATVNVAAGRIGLPTRGAHVTSAGPTPASSAGVAVPAYCRVRGEITPVDPAAPPIQFALDLPAQWNGKAMMLGGGGYDGVIPDTAGLLLGEPAAMAPTPLMRGYATFASDSGHQAVPGAAPIPAVDGAFAVNDEALANYAGDALKKTHDVALALIGRVYGRAPSRTYFAGGSNGGREALTVIQRWPGEYDGVIAAFPFWNAGTTTLAFGSIMNGFAKAGAYPGPAKQALLFKAVMQRCDGLDGLHDGLIANVDACRFDPVTLRCPSGRDIGDSCLADAQIEALRRYDAPTAFAERAKGGETSYPGYPVFAGADLRGAQQMGTTPPVHPATPTMPVIGHFWDQFARFAIARDAAFDPQSLDPQHPGRFAARIDRVVNQLDSRSVDLKAFAARGGRLIIYQGLADPIVSPRSTVRYWQRMRTALGGATTDSFARLYVIPGYGHGPAGLSAFEPAWDPLGVLETWRERGRAPGALSITDVAAGHSSRSRPLCRQGTWPRYDGHGPQDMAASFRCVAE